ncbi:MAG TPA: hypothetical protein DEB74_06235 [Lachnospiraceae bacterium]|nr:hypothetical protein [Lachnospiraceae bacterium]
MCFKNRYTVIFRMKSLLYPQCRQAETYQEYIASGEVIWQGGAFSRLRYNSQMGDELTGLTYLRAQFYNKEIRKFTQEDVIYDDGFNLYAYCSSNPVIYCDPSGFTQKQPCIWKDGSGVSLDSLIGQIPNKFKVLGKCDDFAQSLVDLLEKRVCDTRLYELIV